MGDLVVNTMARSLTEMVAKGQSKYNQKIDVMAAKYQAALGDAAAAYDALPFGPQTKAAYKAGLAAGAGQYASGVRAGAAKWGTNFQRGASK